MFTAKPAIKALRECGPDTEIEKIIRNGEDWVIGNGDECVSRWGLVSEKVITNER